MIQIPLSFYLKQHSSILPLITNMDVSKELAQTMRNKRLIQWSSPFYWIEKIGSQKASLLIITKQTDIIALHKKNVIDYYSAYTACNILAVLPNTTLINNMELHCGLLSICRNPTDTLVDFLGKALIFCLKTHNLSITTPNPYLRTYAK